MLCIISLVSRERSQASSLKFTGRRKGYFFIFQRIYGLKYHSETHRLKSLLLTVNKSLQITISYPLMLRKILLKCLVTYYSLFYLTVRDNVSLLEQLCWPCSLCLTFPFEPFHKLLIVINIQRVVFQMLAETQADLHTKYSVLLSRSLLKISNIQCYIYMRTYKRGKA